MNRRFLSSIPTLIAYNNDTSAWNPQLWARESLAILVENMVMAGLVHRDFENVVANYGEVVNTRRPAEFTAKRKTVNDNITVQNASATNVQVKLNQHVHVSFIIRDGEKAKAFVDLVSEYLEPAMIANARLIDRVILGQHVQFWANVTGGLGKLSSSNATDYIIDTRGLLNRKKAPIEGRNLVWTSDAEGMALKNTIFLKANEVGDGGEALREATLGRKLSFNHVMSQNASAVTTLTDTGTAAINLAAGYAANSTASVFDTLVGTPTANAWLTIDGDNTPQRIVTYTEASSTCTYLPGLRTAVANDAVVTFGLSGAVDNANPITDGDVTLCASGYPVDYAKYITIDSFTAAPQVGQAVSFGLDPTSATYCIVDVAADGLSIMLDRPLEAAIANDAVVNLGPAGQYNFAFRRNAIAMVSRPLPLPEAGGVQSAVVDYKGVGLRVTIGYDQYKQGHLVTVDLLFGIKVLDTNQGAILLG